MKEQHGRDLPHSGAVRPQFFAVYVEKQAAIVDSYSHPNTDFIRCFWQRMSQFGGSFSFLAEQDVQYPHTETSGHNDGHQSRKCSPSEVFDDCDIERRHENKNSSNKTASRVAIRRSPVWSCMPLVSDWFDFSFSVREYPIS
jgi:hypothetical protein